MDEKRTVHTRLKLICPRDQTAKEFLNSGVAKVRASLSAVK